MYISNYSEGRDNNFNLIRFLAAVAVLYSHSYPLFGMDRGILEAFFAKTWGGLAVDIFFISSGFLIMNSFVRRKNSLSFIWARILRIYPGLFIAVLFSGFIVGGCLTTVSFQEFFTDSELWKFVKNNTLLISGGIRYELIGVFENNPYPKAINGSLWTLPYEVKMYFYLFVSASVIEIIERKIRNKQIFKKAYLFFTLLLLCLYVSRDYFDFKDVHLVKLLLMFFIGVNAYNFRDKIKLDLVGFLVSFIVIIFFVITNKDIWHLIYLFLLPYMLFFLAYIPKGKIRKFNLIGDYSYGIYIYSFPVQQSIIYLFPQLSFVMFFMISFFLTLILAILSWFLIEKRSLALKNVFVR